MVYPRLLMYIKNTDRFFSEYELGFLPYVTFIIMISVLLFRKVRLLSQEFKIISMA